MNVARVDGYAQTIAGPNDLWRHVALDAERMDDRAPKNKVVAVYIFISGRQTPVEAGYVGWSRNDPTYPYLRVEAEGARGVEDKLHESARRIHVHRDRIERVEIAFRDKPDGYDLSRFQVTDFNSPFDPDDGTDAPEPT